MQKRKRQERDALFKQQAAERKKVEEVAQATSTQAAQDSNSDYASNMRQSDHSGRRRRADKIRLPDSLPAEFLTDSSSEDEDEDLGARSIRPKKRKLSSIDNKLSRQDRGPRDARVGSTVYRVAKRTDERLAPKAKKQGLATKSSLLTRSRSAAKPRGTFFTKK